MKTNTWHKLTAAIFCLFFAQVTNASLITNGDFETGNLTGWTTFVTANGRLGSPTVTPFDTDGDSVATNSARFNVGEVSFTNNHAGGGIFQNFSFGGGLVDFSVDVASYSLTGGNSSGGLYQLLIDGIVRDTFDSGYIADSAIERDTLTASLSLTAGSHELRILITRPFLSTDVYQYVDSVVAISEQVPEPTTIALMGLGLAGIGWKRRKAA